MYKLIYNPRYHEEIPDSEQVADTIILFTDYLLGFLGKLNPSFTVSQFTRLVLEDQFVPDPQYASLLVNEIPVRKRLDTLVTIYRNRDLKRSNNIRSVIHSILEKLSKSQVEDFFSVVSDELMKTTDEEDIYLQIKIIPHDMWPQVNKLARMRIENWLLELLEDVSYKQINGEQANKTALMCINGIAKYINQKDRLQTAIINQIISGRFNDHNFITGYFADVLPNIFGNEEEIDRCVNAVSDAIFKGNPLMKSFFEQSYSSLPKAWQRYIDEILY
jgi:hypothetical protein